MPAQPLLSVKDLRTWFHTRDGVIKAVEGASFELPRGQTLGIVGESGSGKSVLCYSLLGLLPMPPARIESGTAIFDGTDLIGLGPRRLRAIRGKRIGMVFQDPMTGLNPYMTIERQLVESVRLHTDLSKRAAKTAAVAALDEVGIANAARRIKGYPHEFSGGMRQRVMIAMALIAGPELLIADEPTTALDVTIQAQILDLLARLKADLGLTVIFVTHDLAVISNIADHVIVMRQGEIVESGTSDKIFHRTEHPYTKALLAAIPATAKPASARRAESSGQRLLEVENLATWFGGGRRARDETVKAVDGVTLSIEAGEVLGLVGESGSGKSTLGRTVLRLVDATSGSILFGGQPLLTLDAGALKRVRPKLQMVFQDPYASLDPRMTVHDTLAEPLLNYRFATRGTVLEQVLELIADVGLSPRDIRKYPHEFSGGQRQRIAIARALALRPSLIIADEPVSALDVTVQAQILKLLLGLVERYGLAMLFISHDLAVVRYMSDRTAVMFEGKIVEVGATERVFNAPAHPYTQKLLAAIPRLAAAAAPESEGA